MFTDDNMPADYLKHLPINQSWHCWESFETLRPLKGAFLRILNNVFGSWKWWENVETRPIDGAFLHYRNRFFPKLEQLRTFWIKGQCMMHSDAIWNDVLKFIQF